MIQAVSIFIIPTIIATALAIKQPEQVKIKVNQEGNSVEEQAEPPSMEPERLAIKDYAHSKVDEKFGEGHWENFDKLINKESGWNPNAQNPRSTAYGLAQFLDSTWQNGKTSDPYKQIDEAIEYIADRYGSPTEAWNFHRQRGWY